ncbi:hypothetical protein FOCC_FOCC002860 [Frankliniella occidentalis]|nr:hypothetical protein FOCC_FOCC002860 [Frankliniella occidentalis]
MLLGTGHHGRGHCHRPLRRHPQEKEGKCVSSGEQNWGRMEREREVGEGEGGGRRGRLWEPSPGLISVYTLTASNMCPAAVRGLAGDPSCIQRGVPRGVGKNKKNDRISARNGEAAAERERGGIMLNECGAERDTNDITLMCILKGRKYN